MHKPFAGFGTEVGESNFHQAAVQRLNGLPVRACPDMVCRPPSILLCWPRNVKGTSASDGDFVRAAAGGTGVRSCPRHCNNVQPRSTPAPSSLLNSEATRSTMDFPSMSRSVIPGLKTTGAFRGGGALEILVGERKTILDAEMRRVPSSSTIACQDARQFLLIRRGFHPRAIHFFDSRPVHAVERRIEEPLVDRRPQLVRTRETSPRGKWISHQSTAGCATCAPIPALRAR